MKDFSKAFSKKVGVAENDVYSATKRVTVDNKYLKSVQVKDVKSIITEDCVLWVDADSIPYFAASKQDDNYVEVTHLKSGRKMEFENKTAFKGSSRKEGVITQKSWLGVKNLEQQAKGKPEFKLEDFSIEQKKRLKYKKEDAMRYAIEYMKEYFDAILRQSGCKTMKVVTGSGYNPRYDLLLPKIYKGSRLDQERPILLDKCRDWVQQNYDSVIAEGEEADDVCQRMGYLGTPKVNGLGKYSTMLCALDKDSLGLPCLNFNYQRQGVFWTNPNPWIIEDWEETESVGCIEMQDGKCRTTGLLHIARQICTSDMADGYSMYLHFPKEMHPKESYSDAAFYKQFCILKTPKDVLQGIADRYFETFPNGLKYVAHNGTEVHCDTLTYLEMIFSCVYMLRKPAGEESLKAWFDDYGVDYSKLVNNHIEKVLPLASEESIRSTYNSACEKIVEISDILSNQKGKKDELTDRMTQANRLLAKLWVEVGNGLFEESGND